jgi:mono/diheme cytochrome c family protein
VAYQKNCESCHGENGEGGVVKVDNKRLKVPSLKSDHAIKHPDADLTKQITAGGDGMPAFKDKLKQEEIQSLVQMIRKEFQGK